MHTPPNIDEFDYKLAALAEKVRSDLRLQPQLPGQPDVYDFGFIEAIVEQTDLCFGTWFDFAEASPFCKLIVKGEERLQEIVAAGESERLRIGAIPCGCFEQAEALRRVLAERLATKH